VPTSRLHKAARGTERDGRRGGPSSKLQRPSSSRSRLSAKCTFLYTILIWGRARGRMSCRVGEGVSCVVCYVRAVLYVRGTRMGCLGGGCRLVGAKGPNARGSRKRCAESPCQRLPFCSDSKSQYVDPFSGKVPKLRPHISVTRVVHNKNSPHTGFGHGAPPRDKIR
jgi:hypothetical protein